MICHTLKKPVGQTVARFTLTIVEAGGQTNKKILDRVFDPNDTSDVLRYTAISNGRWDTGKYRFDVYFDNVLVRSLNFTVEE